MGKAATATISARGLEMRLRSLFIYFLFLTLSRDLLAQNALPQATIWLFRPVADSSNLPLTLHMDGRKLASLGSGEFFGVRVPLGLHAFSWARESSGKQVVVAIGPDEQAYLEVVFRSNEPFLFINPQSPATALVAMAGLQPVNAAGVYDLAVIIPTQGIREASGGGSAASVAGSTRSPIPAEAAQTSGLPSIQPQVLTKTLVQPRPARHKSMAATVILWLVVPGGGNFYVGDKTKGFIELGGVIGGYALIANADRMRCYGRYCSDDNATLAQYWGGAAAIATVRVWGLITAINRTADINSGRRAALERLHFTLPTKKGGVRLAYNFSF